jgi:hypothetical protein
LWENTREYADKCDGRWGGARGEMQSLEAAPDQHLQIMVEIFAEAAATAAAAAASNVKCCNGRYIRQAST